MTTNHPINDDLLMGYAAGLLPQAYDLMVATAVSLDDDARARLSSFEAMGGCLLEEVEVAPLRDGCFDEIMGRIAGTGREDTVHTDVKTPRVDAVLPKPLREVLGGDVDVLRWRGVGMGVRQVMIAGDDADEATARLLSIPAGQAMPDHGHSGTEITLVLKGAFIDGPDRYARGDVEIAGDDVEHMPVADLGEDCICLVVTDAPLRFNGLIPRIAQKFLNI
ncbi:ChrR family anti-sigma-E factor [Jannaschia sp. 2305UL9-9]|uniref:ChrR family anti-sigma-E factor n=1 Tax=Jannaschia sp. 2305UL9-9 TaxID=3121638 RepID=UPI0035273546